MITTVRVICFTLLLSAFSFSAGAEDFTNARKSGPKSIPELQTVIETVLKETRTPGAAVAIVSRDKGEWVAGTIRQQRGWK